MLPMAARGVVVGSVGPSVFVVGMSVLVSGWLAVAGLFWCWPSLVSVPLCVLGRWPVVCAVPVSCLWVSCPRST